MPYSATTAPSSCDCARAKHGEIPREESFSLLRVEELNGADAEMLAALDGAQERSGNRPSITGNSKPLFDEVRCHARLASI